MATNADIGKSVQYWGKQAKKPNAAIIVDVSDDGEALTLTAFTASDGRFTKSGIHRRGPDGGEGWTEIGQVIG